MDMNGEQDVVLRGKFAVYPGTEKYDLSVTKTKILMVRGESTDRIEDEIVLQDVIGCHVLHEKKKPGISSYLCVFSYPIKKKKFGSGVVRRRVTRTFTMDTENSYHGNLMLAEMWKMVIKRLIAGELLSTKEDIENGSLKTRNLLVLVNPYSGRKKAMSMYKEKVQPMFAEAEIKHTVKTTEYPGHAKDIAKKLQLEEWDGIVVVSGDGLVHEVINGLMDREDWSEAIKMPIGVVPGGSGNALAAAVVYASTGLHNVAASATMCLFEVCRGAVSSLDLVGMEVFSTGGQKNQEAISADQPFRRIELYSFMNMVIGLIADIDIESENLRCMGGDLRTMVYAIIRILSLRHYDVQVSYLPSSSEGECTLQNGSDVPFVQSRHHGAGDAGLMNSDRTTERGVTSKSKCGTNLPTLDVQLPGSWITERDDFVMVMANFISHIAHDLLPQRHCKLSGGNIYLHLCRESMTRRLVLKAWEKMEDGSGVCDIANPSKSVGTTVICSAFRIVPKGKNEVIITVDGERIPFGTMQCRILPGLARVMTSKANA